MSRTIAAICTPVAPAGLGVIRLSGEEAPAIAARVFRPAKKGESLEALPGYTAMYGHVFDEEGDIDDCVALLFRAPHSYTGENVVELSCHGGIYLLQRTLRALFSAGAFPAGPGEFTRRAFTGGKLDLTRAEAVMNLIEADGRLAARTALAAKEGAVFHRMQGVKERLVAVEAAFSAYVDYPDEDIPVLEEETLRETLLTAKTELTKLLSTFDAGRVLREGVDTVIVGAPNVGKSTLMNLLAGCERSIVTPVAGTTRDVVEETLRLGEVVLRLADTAGIRETEDPVEGIGVRRARARLNTAALVLFVLDGSRPLEAADRKLMEETDPACTVAVVNKADRGIEIELAEISARFPRTVTISAEKGEGVEALATAVEEAVGLAGLTGAEPILATERQRDGAAHALACVEEALAALDGGMTLDAVSVSISGAISAILELTGEKASEAVVEEVFSRFCVGK